MWKRIKFIKIQTKWVIKKKFFFIKYLVFIDLKNAYDKVIYKRLFNQLVEQRISEDIIGAFNYHIQKQN